LPSDLGELPYAEQEARAIASLFQVEPIVGDRATETSLKRQWQGAGYLHLATHGIVAKSDRSGLDTWLALAPDPPGGEDGRLTLAEIFDSQLTAQLAVLSACDTGNGAISGEGTIGLARAFLKAGVPTVVASLWKVPDRPTALLMEEFYRHLLAGRDRATALQMAMQTVRTRYPHPFNWAAFVVIGESR
jgi:CHAT domain-containing protein